MLNSPRCLNPITFDQCDLPSRSFCICIEFLLIFALHICAFPQRWFSNPSRFLPRFFQNSQRWGAGSVIYANSPLPPYSSATLFCYDNADTSSARKMKCENVQTKETICRVENTNMNGNMNEKIQIHKWKVFNLGRGVCIIPSIIIHPLLKGEYTGHEKTYSGDVNISPRLAETKRNQQFLEKSVLPFFLGRSRFWLFHLFFLLNPGDSPPAPPLWVTAARGQQWTMVNNDIAVYRLLLCSYVQCMLIHRASESIASG